MGGGTGDGGVLKHALSGLGLAAWGQLDDVKRGRQGETRTALRSAISSGVGILFFGLPLSFFFLAGFAAPSAPSAAAATTGGAGSVDREQHGNVYQRANRGPVS